VIPDAAPSAPPPYTAGAYARYGAALAVTVGAITSQYFVPKIAPVTGALYGSLAGGLAIVYGIPVAAFLGLVGVSPLRGYARSMGRAGWEGLRWYGLLSALALVVTIGLVLVYEILDPAALELLNRPNPVLAAAASDPAFWIAFSFAVGALEEAIFRGWIFGFWTGRGAWWVHATWTSALFAGVHLYYASTYAEASPLVYPTLFCLGFAFAATYQASGGNLVIVALLHGANDAAGFLSIVSPSLAVGAHLGLIGVGLLVALLHFTGVRPFGPPVVPPPPPVAPWLPPPP